MNRLIWLSLVVFVLGFFGGIQCKAAGEWEITHDEINTKIIRILDDRGNYRMKIEGTASGGNIIFYDDRKTPRLSLTVTDQFGSFVYLFDENGKPLWMQPVAAGEAAAASGINSDCLETEEAGHKTLSGETGRAVVSFMAVVRNSCKGPVSAATVFNLIDKDGFMIHSVPADAIKNLSPNGSKTIRVMEQVEASILEQVDKIELAVNVG